LKPGDVVQLKSGGPSLTVGDVTGLKPDKLTIFTEDTEFTATVICYWFTVGGDLREAVFLVDTLRMITEI